MLDKLADKFSPKVVAVLVLPAMLIVSLPFSFIGGVIGIIITGNELIGWGVGIAVATLFALWAAYGMYHLTLEAQQEEHSDLLIG